MNRQKQIYSEFKPENFIKENKDGFLCIVSSPRRTGKTVLITDFIKRMQATREWDKIYLFSETALAQTDAYQFIPSDCKFNSLDLQVLDSIISEQSEARQESDRNPEKKVRRVLVIADDIINDKAVRKNNSFSRLATQGRHYRIDCFAITQHLKAFPPVFRKNSDLMVVWRSIEFANREIICEDFLMLEDGKKSEIKRQAINLLNKICCVQYRALVIETWKSSYAQHTSDYVTWYMADPKAKPKMIGDDYGRSGYNCKRYNTVDCDGKEFELNLRFKIRDRKKTR